MNAQLVSKVRAAAGPLWGPLYGLSVLASDYHSWRFMPAWMRSIRQGHLPVDDAIPLLPFVATQWLEAHLSPEMTVFEFGSGGSTLFLAQRVAHVFSVEHDAMWYAVVSAALALRHLTNVTFLLRKPQPIDKVPSPGAVMAPHEESITDWEPGVRLNAYVETVDGCRDGSLDRVLVDGRARSACIARSLGKIRQRGFLMLDNSNEPAFGDCLEIPRGYPRTDLRGLGPCWPPRRWRTTVWQLTSKGDESPS
jgi:hypothetical protein